MRRKRKVLMITPYLPYPPASGGQIRTLNLLKHLAKENEIHLVSLYKKQAELKFVKHLKKLTPFIYPCKRAESPWQFKLLLKAVVSPYPFLIVRNFSSQAQKTIKNLMKEINFDLIHAETFYVMPHIPKTKKPILLVEQTIEFLVYKEFVDNLPLFFRKILSLELFRLRYWEVNFWKKAAMVVPVSRKDERIIKDIIPNVKTAIVPNGAGDDMFVKKLPKRNLTKPLLLFVGNFLWIQNQEPALFLIEKLAPLLAKELPQAKIMIAGQHLNEKVKIKHIPKNVILKNIEEKDSQKIKEYYKKATLFLAPITGPGGTRLKILAAMASGLPIIASQIAINGLDLKNEKHYIRAETEKEYLDTIKRVISNPILYYNIQKQAYTLTKEKYSWKKIAGNLQKIYEKLTN